MMARVTLGHTGRSVRNPPILIGSALKILVAGILIRVIIPLFIHDYYVLWIAISQLLWILAFAIFLGVCGGMLLRPRADGQPG